MKRRSFFKNSEGSVLITTCLGIVMLVGVAGMSIDLGRQQLMRARIQQSSDAAALAGATGGINATSSQTAMRYFNLNFSTSYQGQARPTPTIQADTAVSVAASGNVPATFVKGVTTGATSGRSVVVPDVVNGTTQIYDLVLVMDKTGSMTQIDPGQTQTRMAGLKSAAKTLVDSLLKPNATSRIGAVAFNNLTPPSSLPLTTSANSVNAFIDGMVAQSWTDTSTGMAAAIPMIQAAGSVTAGGVNNVIRAVVLLTDGENTYYQGQQIANPSAPNAATVQYCAQLKAMTPATVIYTIGYGPEVASSGSPAQQLLISCATPSALGGNNMGEHVFIASDATALLQAFHSIAIDLKRMRISE